jgi:hypothetical protein
MMTALGVGRLLSHITVHPGASWIKPLGFRSLVFKME